MLEEQIDVASAPTRDRNVWRQSIDGARIVDDGRYGKWTGEYLDVHVHV